MSDNNSLVNQARARIERADQSLYSKQPRFKAKDAEHGFYSIMDWGLRSENKAPAWQKDTRVRDKWLRDFWRKEPLLSGVLSSAIAIDANRGWRMVGGVRQVSTYSSIFLNAEDGSGWRFYIGQQAGSYYWGDLGGITEFGRSFMKGPLRGLYTVDHARCRRKSSRKKPLEYFPDGGKSQLFGRNDFMRVVSMPTEDETMLGIGYCFISRALIIAQLMIGIYNHELGEVGAKAPRGLLLLLNISQEQWDEAMAQRDAERRGDEQYYNALAVLATPMGMSNVDAKLIALSQLPKGFDREKWVDILMYSYALDIGFDPSEFWVVKHGSLGRGTETDVQDKKATGKGSVSFIRAWQDGISPELPQTLMLEFDERDSRGDLFGAKVEQIYAKIAGDLSAGGLLSIEEARAYMAERKIIPPEWTEIVEAAEATDTRPVKKNRKRRSRLKILREHALTSANVWRAINEFPDEPIIQYEWPKNTSVMLWPKASDALKREVWSVPILPNSNGSDGANYESIPG